MRILIWFGIIIAVQTFVIFAMVQHIDTFDTRLTAIEKTLLIKCPDTVTSSVYNAVDGSLTCIIQNVGYGASVKRVKRGWLKEHKQ